MLHLYESFGKQVTYVGSAPGFWFRPNFRSSVGWWREPDLRKVHNAEEWNELHHLLIMESLGGDKYWVDRFLGYHAAILYYWLLVVTYLFSPKVSSPKPYHPSSQRTSPRTPPPPPVRRLLTNLCSC